LSDALPAASGVVALSETPKAPPKGLILAGGRALRLRPLSYTGAKQLVPIANKPIVFYAIEQLVSCGITEIGIVSGENMEQFQQAIGDGSGFGASVTYIYQPLPLGIAQGVKTAQPFIGESPFVLFLGDNFIREGIAPYVDRFRSSGHNALLLLCPVDDPSSLGIAELDGSRLVRVIEKPKDPPTNLAIIGIYFFDHHVFDAIDAIKPSARGELEITDSIQRLIDDGLDVQAQEILGRWIDTGKHDDILSANHLILETLDPTCDGSVDSDSKLEGRVVIQQGAELVNSRIHGPAIIGERTRVVNSYVGPFTSIYHDCLIEDTEISGSAVLEHTTIQSVGHRIEHSLIGRNVHIRGNDHKPSSYKLILGDFSNVRMP
jgi:glucose-1-phosphate thymidylyltransferase